MQCSAMQVVEANVVRGKDYGFVHLSAGLDLAWLDQVEGNITHLASLCGHLASLFCHLASQCDIWHHSLILATSGVAGGGSMAPRKPAQGEDEQEAATGRAEGQAEAEGRVQEEDEGGQAAGRGQPGVLGLAGGLQSQLEEREQRYLLGRHDRRRDDGSHHHHLQNYQAVRRGHPGGVLFTTRNIRERLLSHLCENGLYRPDAIIAILDQVYLLHQHQCCRLHHQ